MLLLLLLLRHDMLKIASTITTVTTVDFVVLA